MRELLTGLAIVLIVALTAALVAPYLIDWNSQRTFIEARLSDVLGQKVTIGGAIDVKLLPTPYLVLGQTVIGSDEGPVRLSIHHLDLELSPTPLLHGEFDVTQARLVEPTIRVTLQPDRTLPALPDAPAFHADVSLDHIAVTGGTLAVADPPSGRTFVLDNLDFEADAASLAGPFKGAGTEGPVGEKTSFRFSTAAAHDGRARTRLIIAENADHAGLDLEGTLALTSAGRAAIRQSFDGKVTVTDKLEESDGAPVAWTLTGPLVADPNGATLDGGELRLGGEDKGLTLAASGDADLGSRPRINLDLSAKTLDLDRLSVTSSDGKQTRPPQLPPLATLRHALSAATPPLPTTLDIKVDTATWAGATLADLAAHIGLGGDGAQPLTLAGTGPGGARLKLDGTLFPDRFAGKVALGADDPARSAAWLAAIGAPLPVKPADLPTGALALSADVGEASNRIAATNLAMTLGRSDLRGSATFALADGTKPPRVTADLTAKVLDLDTVPDLAAWRRASLDLDVRLDAQALRIAEVGSGQFATGHARVALTRSGRRLALTSFEADDLGGASIAGDGTLDPQSAHLALRVDARRLDTVAQLATQMAPGTAADTLAARAPMLAPAKFKLDATWSAGAKGALTPTRASLQGTFGASSLDASLAPQPDVPQAVAIKATLAAPESAPLLAQLGVPALPIDRIGRSTIALEAHGKADQPLDTKLSATLGATTIDVGGRFRLLAEPFGGSGTLKVASQDISPLLRSLALTFPDMTARLPATMDGTLGYGTAGLGLTDLKAKVAGMNATGTLRFAPETRDAPAVTGSLDLDRLALAGLLGLALGPEQPAAPQSAWSNLAFGAGLVDPPRAALDLTAKTLDIAPGLVATNAALELGVAPSMITLKRLTATLAGGRTSGTLSIRRDGQQAGVEGKLDVDHVSVELPGIQAKMSGKLDIAGGGTSAQGLLASLAGSGEATLIELSIPEADPAALQAIFAEVESDDLSVDAETVERAYAGAARAPLRAGTRSFDLTLAGGTLAFAPKSPERAPPGGVESAIDASLDLRQPTLTTRATETLQALPKGWSGKPPSLVVAWSGAPRAPQRNVDVSAFINAVAARALARESARIEAYELDIRERAFFNARLQSERRRAQDKAKAEADAREAKARRDAAARAAKAAQEKAAQDRAAQDRAAQDRAAQDKATQDRGTQNRDDQPKRPPDAAPPDGGADRPPPSRFQAPPPGAQSDPSAAGRY